MIKNWYNNYKTWSPSLKLALYATAFCLVCMAVFLPFYLKKIKEINALQSQIQEVEHNLREGKALEVRCSPATDDEKKIWTEVRDNMYRRIPPEKRLLQLVKDIAKVADDCSIHDVSFTMPASEANSVRRHSTVHHFPNSAAEDDASPADEGNGILDLKLNTFTIRTDFHCEYQALAHFLKGINNLDRLLEVESLEIKRRLPLMEVELAIHAFYSQGRDDA